MYGFNPEVLKSQYGNNEPLEISIRGLTKVLAGSGPLV
jgi:hypothetical protein